MCGIGVIVTAGGSVIAGGGGAGAATTTTTSTATATASTAELTATSTTAAASTEASPLAAVAREVVADALAGALARRGPDGSGRVDRAGGEVTLLAAVLHMRGAAMTAQPVALDGGDVLCWNGEVFGGVDVAVEGSDTDVVAGILAGAHGDPVAAAHACGSLLGPWAFLYWHAASDTLLFARDPVGRRPLVMHLPDDGGMAPHLVIASTAVPLVQRLPDGSDEDTEPVPLATALPFVEVVPSGVYALRRGGGGGGGEVAVWDGVGQWAGWRLTCAPWAVTIPAYAGRLQPDGTSVAPGCAVPAHPPAIDTTPPISDAEEGVLALELLHRLAQSVRLRVANLPAPQALPGASAATAVAASIIVRDASHGATPDVSEALSACTAAGLPLTALPALATAAVDAASSDPPRGPGASVAIMYSGGIDSQLLAALAHRYVPPDEPIDLLNVCFAPTHNSPDRLGALRGVRELAAAFPSRTWQLICIDEAFDAALRNQEPLAHLMAPALTHMDFSIGSCLWFTARGIGWVDVAAPPDGSGAVLCPGGAAAGGDAPTKQLRYARSDAPAASGSHTLSIHDARGSAPPAAALAANPHAATAATVDGAALAASFAPLPSAAGRTSAADTLGTVSVLPPAVAACLAAWEAAVPPTPAGSALPVLPTRPEREIAAAVSPAAAAAAAAAPAPVPPAALPEGAAPDAVSAVATAGPRKPTRPCSGWVEAGLPCTAVAHRRCKHHMCRPCCIEAARGGGRAACAVHQVPVGGGAPASGSVPAAAAVASASVAAAAAPAAAATATETATHYYRVLVRSSARVLLSGIGADEQAGGYSRHRTAFAHGGWRRLAAELANDSSRIWRRNLGRDDRVCASHGREVRLPFLDEAVSAYLRRLPMPFVADLRLPHGVGDKRIVRVAAALAGLRDSTCLVKRAIHFGSRLAKQSNLHSFGSNRAGRGDAAYLFSAAGRGAGGDSGSDGE